jgi:two-component system, NarL family, sensor histidine kinase DevS
MSGDFVSPRSPANALAGLRLDELLRGVQDRLAEIVPIRHRTQGLLDAVLAVASNLELDATLQRIVQVAVDLVEAPHGALGLPPHHQPMHNMRLAWLEALAEIRTELLSGAIAEDALALVALRTVELTGSDVAFIGLGTERVDGRFTVRAQCGAEDIGLVGRTLDAADPVLCEVVGGRTAVRAYSATGLLDGAGDDLRDYGPAVAVPLASQDRVIGVLVALRRRERQPFQPGEVLLLASFAEQATLAFEVGEKNRAQRQLDVFSDRERIARDLHDHAIQRLLATGLQLQSALRRTSDPIVGQRIEQAVDELDETVREIRAAIFDLHTTGEGAAGGRG